MLLGAKLTWAPASFVHSHHQGGANQDSAALGRKYTFVKEVGRGRFGTVFIVQHTASEKQYACKVVSKIDGDVENLRREIGLLCMLDHPNIIRLYETFEDMDSVYLLMELTQSGDLFDLIKRGPVSERSSKHYTRQLLSALAYCHAYGVAHMDIKAENVLVEGGNFIKLVDFGIAKKFRSFQRTPRCTNMEKGSDGYMAPELLSEEEDKSEEDDKVGLEPSLFACDCWSAGCLIYLMLTGTLPFGDRYHPTRELKYTFLWETMPEAQVLVSQLLEVDPNLRLRAQQALQSSTWITGLVRLPSRSRSRSIPFVPYYSPNAIFSKRNSHSVSRKGKRTSPRRRTPHLNVPTPCTAHATPSSCSWGSDGEGPLRAELIKAQEMASWVLDALRIWAQVPELVRIVKTCVARRLDADYTKKACLCFTFLSETYGFSGGAISRTNFEIALQRALRGGPTDSDNPSAPTESSSLRVTPGPIRRGSLPNLTSSSLPVGKEWRALYNSTSCSDRNDDSDGEASFVPIFVSNEEMSYLVETLDCSGDRYVKYSLFLAAVVDPRIYHDTNIILDAFEIFDVRQSGIIEGKDFRLLLQYRSPWTRSELAESDMDERYNELIRPFDTNGDGGLDFEEFGSLLTGNSELVRKNTLSSLLLWEEATDSDEYSDECESDFA